MTDWQHPNPDDWLEQDLQGLAREAIFPATPAFTMPRPQVQPPLRPAHYWLQAGLAIAACVLAILVNPDVRHAAADLFGIPAIRIEFGDQSTDPPAEVTSIGGTLLLGQPATLEAASERFGGSILVPGGSLVGISPEVYVNQFQGVPVVSLLYPASDVVPEIGSTGVGLLIMAIDDDGSSRYLIAKRATGEMPPRTVSVNGSEGVWIEGGVLTVDTGDPFWTYQRRSGSVLVWYQDGITYRMESSLPLEAALDVAESLEPSGTSNYPPVYH
jgi:hypothetical protein